MSGQKDEMIRWRIQGLSSFCLGSGEVRLQGLDSFISDPSSFFPISD